MNANVVGTKYSPMPQFETIQFRLILTAEYWDLPPCATILINDVEKFDGAIIGSKDLPQEIVFSHMLEFGKTYQLTIDRYNKNSDQCQILKDGSLRDQLLQIHSVIIDGINIRDIVWTQSNFFPVYPEPWATEQLNLGVVLENNIIGETLLGHNGNWVLEIQSPFWQYIFNESIGL